ncbi:YhgE/Pip domain-containing protein [Fructilactobacillus sp. Tb1]|uniref:YhgE/Pip domain-containing protein n=1 Tax=Fructilactobacillus sp. Tb1 TaxID=3422304 RepID=UPI003D29B453
MKRILKNKFFGFAILAALFVTLIITLFQFPTAKATIQNVPVGIVNLDQGPQGKELTKKVMSNKTKAAHADKPMFKWHEYKTTKEADKALNFDGNYATVIIPKNLSQSMGSIAQTGQKVNIKIIVNQGRNNTLSTNVNTILTNMFSKIGTSIGAGMLTKMGMMNVQIPAAKAEAIANPFSVETTTVHSTKNLEAASSVFFQPIWIVSLVMTMLLYFASRSFKPKHKKDVLAFKGSVVVITALLSLVSGFCTTFLC